MVLEAGVGGAGDFPCLRKNHAQTEMDCKQTTMRACRTLVEEVPGVVRKNGSVGGSADIPFLQTNHA